MIRHPDTTQKGTQAPLVARARRDSVLRVRLPLGWPSLPLLRTSSHIILAKCCWLPGGAAALASRFFNMYTCRGLSPGSEWILHGCDFGCDSDVNFRCEDLTEDSAWM